MRVRPEMPQPLPRKDNEVSSLCCVTNDIPTDHLRGISMHACTVLDQHAVICDGWAYRLVVKVDPKTGEETHRHVATGRQCRGCLPREARVGLLCNGCWVRLEQALADWPAFVVKLSALEGRPAVSGTGGGGSVEGYVPLPGTALSVDECERYLQGLGWGDARRWVSTVDGARDAVLFTRAAEVAYRSHQVEENTRRLKRVRCPQCKQLQPSLMRRPPEFWTDDVRVTCETPGCGKTITAEQSLVEIARIERLA